MGVVSSLPLLSAKPRQAPFGGGTDDEDDDAMSNHSFFSNPHSIGKSHHSADAGRNEETHAADGVGHQPNSADGMDFNRHGSPEASRTNSHAPSRLSPTMPSGELPEAKIREEEHKKYAPALTFETLCLFVIEWRAPFSGTGHHCRLKSNGGLAIA